MEGIRRFRLGQKSYRTVSNGEGQDSVRIPGGVRLVDFAGFASILVARMTGDWLCRRFFRALAVSVCNVLPKGRQD